MKKLVCLVLTCVLVLGCLAGCGSKNTTWTVTCPWAESGVASMVSQKAAAKSIDYSKEITLVAQAIKGDAATVNTWCMDTKADDPELVFVGEGLLSITSEIDPAKMQFTADDFVFVENLYSSIFVLSADSELGLKSIPDLQEYVKTAGQISVATNGATGSEAFLAAALFGSMGADLKIVPYTSAGEAAQAVSKGETMFAISHQSQILEASTQGNVTVIAAFDDKAIESGAFAGVEGVGAYGYPYFRNRCFVMARKGTDAGKVAAVKELYGKILNDAEVSSWLADTMLLEVDLMTEADVQAHVENVRSIVIQYKDVVTG